MTPWAVAAPSPLPESEEPSAAPSAEPYVDTTEEVNAEIDREFESFIKKQKNQQKKNRSLNEEMLEIPTAPTTPRQLSRTVPEGSYRCQRQYKYKGKLQGCDSYLHQDAERLRPILQDIPEAVAELDAYQENRRSIQKLAYVGTLGLGMYLLGGLIGDRFTARDPADTKKVYVTNTGQAVKRLSKYLGLGIAAGSIAYGFTVLHTNEKHLRKAVDVYNRARPDDPVELMFNASIQF